METRHLMIAALSAAMLLALVAVPANAHHKPTSYCSETGDICQSVRKVEGVRKLQLVMTDKYFRRFHLCLSQPNEVSECKRLRVKALDDGLFGRSVRWPGKWGSAGKGAYTVKWREVQEQPWPGPVIGEALGFHRQ